MRDAACFLLVEELMDTAATQAGGGSDLPNR
jgi:hypothetical protein